MLPKQIALYNFGSRMRLLLLCCRYNGYLVIELVMVLSDANRPLLLLSTSNNIQQKQPQYVVRFKYKITWPRLIAIKNTTQNATLVTV